MARLTEDIMPVYHGGFDLASDCPGAREARANGDLSGFLQAIGCPEKIARRAAKREQFLRTMKPKTRQDHENIEKAVRAGVDIEMDLRGR